MLKGRKNPEKNIELNKQQSPKGEKKEGDNAGEIGIATVIMSKTGPQTTVNLSPLDELATMYLSVKGFTAFLTGFEGTGIGPGRIRGILQIPTTNFFAVAIDQNMRGSGAEEDVRLKQNRIAIICLIADNDDLFKIRLFFNETEQFLREKLSAISSIEDLNESFVRMLKNEYNAYINRLMSEREEASKQGSKEEPKSLFDAATLLSLPPEENLSARTIINYMGKPGKKGVTLEDICKITKRRKKKEREILNKLLEKGLIIIKSPEDDQKEILYIAQ